VAISHTVKQGEHLSRIARQYGFLDFRIIWNHPNNAALKARRVNPHVLFPGDVLYIPDKEQKTETRPTGQTHIFEVLMPKLLLRLALRDFDNLPITDVDCELEVEGQVYRLTSDQDGKIEQKIPITAETGTLRIPSLAMNRAIRIGYLDPEGEDSGWKARLINLGYLAGVLGEPDEERFHAALEEFQCDQNLKITGNPDQATRVRLKEVHGG
jgi:hypothetical protein